MGPTDAELIARSVRDPACFAEVFDRHYDTIYRYAAARLGVDDGQEVAAQTFLVALERVDRYDGSRPDARPWLFGIATNLVRRHHRSQGRAVRAHARLRGHLATLPRVDEGARVDLQQDVRPVMEAVDRLPRMDRDVLLLFAWAELSYDEIAEALLVPVGTVRSRLHRARLHLRTLLAVTDGEVP